MARDPRDLPDLAEELINLAQDTLNDASFAIALGDAARSIELINEARQFRETAELTFTHYERLTAPLSDLA